MRRISILACVVLASGLVALPAHADLVGNVVSALTSGGGGSSAPASAPSSPTSTPSAVGGVGIPNVATVSGSNTNAPHIGATLLGGRGDTLTLGKTGAGDIGATLPGFGGGTVGRTVHRTVAVVNGAGGRATNGVTSDIRSLDPVLARLLGVRLVAGASANGAGAGVGGGFGLGSAGGTQIGGGACTSNLSGVLPLLQIKYNRAALKHLHDTDSGQLVPVRLCGKARAELARAAANNPNIVGLRQAAAADPMITNMLSDANLSQKNVIAAGVSNGLLSVVVF